MTRDRHCQLAKLNSNGKCIAPCTYNQRNLYKMDCTGNTGKTMDTRNNHEVQLERRCKITT